MKKPLSFLFTVHFHQPVGNFGFVIEKIANECYEPFLDLIAEFPEFIRDYIKNNSLDIEIREERTSMDISLKKIVCRWVKIEIFDTEGHKCGC